MQITAQPPTNLHDQSLFEAGDRTHVLALQAETFQEERFLAAVFRAVLKGGVVKVKVDERIHTWKPTNTKGIK